MPKRRVITAMEFVSPEGFRFALDPDGWRIVKPRNLGETQIQDARVILARAEDCQPPVDPLASAPPTVQELGEYVAKRLNLRINHHDFTQR